jgi:hypothetical protein
VLPDKLLKRDLAGFQIIEMHLVRDHQLGKIGCFPNKDLADAFKENHSRGNCCVVEAVTVLTDGVVSYCIGADAVKVFDNKEIEEVVAKTKALGIASLTALQRKYLGLK